MANEKKKMTAPDASVGADTRQSNSQINSSTIPDPVGKSNSTENDFEAFFRQIQRMNDPSYLRTVTLDELMDRVFQGKSAIIDTLLYTGAYSHKHCLPELKPL